MPTRIRAILLDLGNVLVFHDNALLFRQFAERAGLGAEEAARRMEGTLWDDINRGKVRGDRIRTEICAKLGVELPPDEFFALWNCHFTLHEAVLPRIEELASRVKLLLFSNTNDQHTRFLFPQLPVLKRFDHLLLSYEVGAVKPERAFFEAGLAKAGTAPEETAFFDDVGEYVDAARALGIEGRLFTDAARFDADLKALGLLEG